MTKKQLSAVKAAHEKEQKRRPRVLKAPAWRAGAKLEEGRRAAMWMEGRIDQAELAVALGQFLREYLMAFPGGAIKGEYRGDEGQVLKRVSGARAPQTLESMLHKMNDPESLQINLRLPGSPRTDDSSVSIQFPIDEDWHVVAQFAEVPKAKSPLRRVSDLLFAVISPRMLIQECDVNPK